MGLAVSLWREIRARTPTPRLLIFSITIKTAISPTLDDGSGNMKVAAGETVYSHGTTPCSGSGLIWSSDDLDIALSGPVSALVFDDEGRADVENILRGLVETDFEYESLRTILSNSDNIEDWRVGEAIAEAYLADHRDCLFPWPDGRDERKSGSSLPGADLVGIQSDETGNCFAFGEVKTSAEARYPPKTVYGRTGMEQQIEDLRDCATIRDNLVRYLCYRAKFATWRSRFESASKRYLQNDSDIHLYGVLIRDVEPRADDLRMRVIKLAENRPEKTRIELLALYLPQGRINGIGTLLVSQRTGGDG